MLDALVRASLDGEEWRQVSSFPRYWVSNLGRVFSTIRTGRILARTIGSHGYPYVSLMAEGAQSGTKVLVHRLVAEAFVDGEGETVNHKDGDKENAAAANLEWCSYATNNEHAKATGLSENFGSRHAWAKLTEEDVRQVRAMLEAGDLHRVIASRFGVRREAITKIASGKRWRRSA